MSGGQANHRSGSIGWRVSPAACATTVLAQQAVPAGCRRYDLPVSRADALVDEIANELDTWPGVHIERVSPSGDAVVRYKREELGFLAPERGVAELRFARLEHDELVEHGEAEPADSASDSGLVRHDVEGPSDVTAVLELFDRRYREVRGEDYPDSVEDRF
jgi:hypothetical protein